MNKKKKVKGIPASKFVPAMKRLTNDERYDWNLQDISSAFIFIISSITKHDVWRDTIFPDSCSVLKVTMNANSSEDMGVIAKLKIQSQTMGVMNYAVIGEKWKYNEENLRQFMTAYQEALGTDAKIELNMDKDKTKYRAFVTLTLDSFDVEGAVKERDFQKQRNRIIGQNWQTDKFNL